MSHSGPSRRTITKGAAWSVPVVAMGAMTPAIASSGNDPRCAAGPVWRDTTIASAPTVGVSRAPGGQSTVSLNLGAISPDVNKPSGTHYYVFQPTSVSAVDQYGNVHHGVILTSTNTQYSLAGGGAMNVRARFDDFPYDVGGDGDPDWTAAHNLHAYTVSYTVTYRNLVFRDVVTCSYTSTVRVTDWASTYVSGDLSDFRV